MIKVALETVGCRLNQYETERLAADLVAAGMDRVSYNKKADLYILNSCTVTGRADADCRKLINRAHRKNKDAIIVLAGCYVDSDRARAAELNGVDLIIGNREKSDLKKSIQKNYPHLIDDQKDKPNASMTPTTDKLFGDYSRAMVKIADGCNQHCAYCIVPRVRGKFYSLEANDIMDEINALVANGFHEVVLTAVHIGKYNSNGLNLAGLIDKILDETKLARLRLSSLEPNELDGQLIELVAGHPRVCRHLHLPLQSGSDKILESMQRPYRKNDYLRIIEKIKNHNEDITVGCDLIVGFTGETEADFKESLEILDSGYLDYSHVFSYSDRPGTVASRMTGKINALTIKERNRIARELIHKRKIIHYMSQLDKELCVIPELVARKDGFVNALSDNYIKIKISPDSPWDRKILKVRSNRLAEKGEKNICLTGDVVA